MNKLPNEVHQLIMLWLDNPDAFKLSEAKGYEEHQEYLEAFEHGYYTGKPIDPPQPNLPKESFEDKIERLLESSLNMISQPLTNSYDSFLELTDKYAMMLIRNEVSSIEKMDPYDARDCGYRNYRSALNIIQGRKAAMDEADQEAFDSMVAIRQEEG